MVPVHDLHPRPLLMRGLRLLACLLLGGLCLVAVPDPPEDLSKPRQVLPETRFHKKRQENVDLPAHGGWDLVPSLRSRTNGAPSEDETLQDFRHLRFPGLIFLGYLGHIDLDALMLAIMPEDSKGWQSCPHIRACLRMLRQKGGWVPQPLDLADPKLLGIVCSLYLDITHIKVSQLACTLLSWPLKSRVHLEIFNPKSARPNPKGKRLLLHLWMLPCSLRYLFVVKCPPSHD